jgi:hypothetical protein
MTEADLLEESFAEPLLPRSNGEPDFDEPWQARALALAVLFVDRSGCRWSDFRERLIDAIASDPDGPYWGSWLTALEEFVHSTEFDSRVEQNGA